MTSWQKALKRLRDGNQRFASSHLDSDLQQRRPEFKKIRDQKPFAVVFGCSDSRVPVEILFDQGVGDLFVIRVAGHIVTPSQIESVEFAVTEFDTPLVVVLGHSQCGAVLATLRSLQNPTSNPSLPFHSIREGIQPSVQGLVKTDDPQVLSLLIPQAVRAHVHACVNQLKIRSEKIQSLIQSQHLQIMGAEYSLEKGVVEFFDN